MSAAPIRDRPETRSSWPGFLRRAFQRSEWGLLLATVIVVSLTALLDRDHNYLIDPGSSAVEILRQVSLLGIFTLGAAVVIIAGGIDLSSGSVIAFSGSICASLLILLGSADADRPLGWFDLSLAIGGTILVGFLIGSLHAWLITVVKLPPFVATLSTLVGLRSLARIIVKSLVSRTQIDLSEKRFEAFEALAADLRIPALVFAGLALLMWLLMSRTVVGRHLVALGGNEVAARLSGIQTDRMKWLAYALSAMLSSIAGIFYVSQTTVAAPETLARGYELNAIAAAVVGGCSLQGGIGTIPGTVLGVVFLRVVMDFVPKVIKQQAEVYEGLLVGVVVVVAVAFTQVRQGGWRRHRFFTDPVGLVVLAAAALLAGGFALILTPLDPESRAQITRASLATLIVLSLASAVGAVILRRRTTADQTSRKR